MICLAYVSLEFANCPVVNFFRACCGQNCERPRSRHDNVVCFCLVFDISFLRCPCLFKDAQNMDAVMTRLRRLEDAQKATVDSCLEEFRHLIKSPMFTRDRALDRVVNLKMVAKEANHPKSGFFEAVFRAFREKTGVTDDQFTKYLEVLLGDKDHEKVLESIAKVDKAMRISSPPASRGFSYYRGAWRVNRSSVQCYYCYQFGHYQNSCPLRLPRRVGSGPPPKRGRFSEQLKK